MKKKILMIMCFSFFLCSVLSLGGMKNVEAATNLKKGKTITTYVTKGKTVSFRVKTSGKLRKVTWKITSGSSKGKIVGKKSRLVKSYKTKTVKIKGIKKGTVKLQTTYKGKKYKATIVVETPSLDKKSVKMKQGETVQLQLKGTKQKKKWKTSDSNVATVDSNGKVTAVKPGTCNIYGYAGSSKYTCKVSVSENSSTPYQAKYTYEVKLLNQHPVYTTYGEKKLDGTTQGTDLAYIYIYIKTATPNPNTIYLENPRGISGIKNFKDVTLGKLSNLGAFYGTTLYTVKGGYLGVIGLKSTGNNSVEVREVSGAKNDLSYQPRLEGAWKQDVNSQRVAALSIPNVKSYSATEKSWYQKVIAEQTTSSMTEKQKMDAIVSYLSKNFKYFACSLSPNEYLPLISHQGAYWDTKEVDCVRYCWIINNFASFLGLKGESTYAGYSNHYYSTVTFSDGSSKFYDNAPNSYSNIVTDWKMLDE